MGVFREMKMLSTKFLVFAAAVVVVRTDIQCRGPRLGSSKVATTASYVLYVDVRERQATFASAGSDSTQDKDFAASKLEQIYNECTELYIYR